MNSPDLKFQYLFDQVTGLNEKVGTISYFVLGLYVVASVFAAWMVKVNDENRENRRIDQEEMRINREEDKEEMRINREEDKEEMRMNRKEDKEEMKANKVEAQLMSLLSLVFALAAILISKHQL